MLAFLNIFLKMRLTTEFSDASKLFIIKDEWIKCKEREKTRVSVHRYCCACIFDR